MQWTDDGIILATRPHGETSLIVEAMTPAHGRVMGLVRGGRSRTRMPTLQPGNEVALTWRARLDEHLGQFTVEPLRMNAALLMERAVGLHGFQMTAAHLRLLPEREAAEPVHAMLAAMLPVLCDPQTPEDAGALLARFEIALLAELGFGLDLARCALSGAREGLAYVSPKSGRAVTAEAGGAWAGRLLVLPSFLAPGANAPADRDAVRSAFALTGHFIERQFFTDRRADALAARAMLIDRVRRRAG